MNTTAQLTQRHRAQQLLLRQSTVSQMSKLWPALDWARLDKTYPAFAVQVGALVQTNQRISAGLASQYIRAFRKASGVPGEVKIILADPFNVDQFQTSLRVTSVVAAKKSAGLGILEEFAMADAFTQASGAMARLVLDAGRNTTMNTIKHDRRAIGWERIGGGATCSFCEMLISRGPVYGEAGAFFASHDHCGCSAAPVYSDATTGDYVQVGDYVKSSRSSLIPDNPALSNRDRLKISKRNRSTILADKNRKASARAWMKANPDSN